MVTKGAKGLVPTTDWEKRPSSSVLGAVGEARRSDQPKKMQLERNNLDTLALGCEPSIDDRIWGDSGSTSAAGEDEPAVSPG
jgi:hypothetical protein